MKTKFNGDVLRSHVSGLGTASGLQRGSVRGNLDCEYAELPGIHFGFDGCLDAPDLLPAGSTVPEFKPGFVCDARPAMNRRLA